MFWWNNLLKMSHRFKFRMITVESNWVKQFENSIYYDGLITGRRVHTSDGYNF